eukprot:gnl/Dysnectes_brevis/1314_a1475_4086.p2 GENE.gnl/Dysnectes_brevis/1314_a1475_4086~~gnl/Dysnectes_brevis/1314_a1475_4086.p2  ORF type:complete len:208 (+),score=78.70 gnl/Dysnectes_brevis/1314_a1475_4086:161-784(+)
MAAKKKINQQKAITRSQMKHRTATKKTKTSRWYDNISFSTLMIAIAIAFVILASGAMGVVRSSQAVKNRANGPQDPSGMNSQMPAPSIAGIEIPMDVLTEVQSAEGQDEQRVIIESWATGHGIEFEYGTDGSIIATRDGVEYVVSGPTQPIDEDIEIIEEEEEEIEGYELDDIEEEIVEVPVEDVEPTVVEEIDADEVEVIQEEDEE